MVEATLDFLNNRGEFSEPLLIDVGFGTGKSTFTLLDALPVEWSAIGTQDFIGITLTLRNFSAPLEPLMA